MGRRLRMYGELEVYSVTFRAYQGRSLFPANEQMDRVFAGVLARAARLHEVLIHAYSALTTHGHLECSARDGRLSDFMEFFLTNLSKKVGKLINWEGSKFEHRFAEQPIFGPQAEEDRMAYIISHGVKEGLVRRAEDWPGVSCVKQLLSGEDRQVPFYEWTKRYENGRLRKDAGDPFDDRWAVMETLRLEPLPCWVDLSAEERGRRVRAMLQRAEEDARKAFRTVLGKVRVRATEIGRRPEKLKRSPQPLCHADTREAFLAYRSAYRDFVSWFRQASERYLRGDLLAIFPPRSFRPPRWSLAGAG